MFSGAAASNRRNSLAWRGPANGLRPVCCASCWYICFAALLATGAVAACAAGTAEGDGCTAAALAAGDGTGETAALATGETAGAATGEAGAAEGAAEAAGAAEARAGGLVGGWAGAPAGAAVGAGVADPWQAASSPVPHAASRAPAPLMRRRRVKCINVPLVGLLLASVDLPRVTRRK